MAGRPVCVKCRRFYRCKKNETTWEEGGLDKDGNRCGYRLWYGDLWECPGCGTEIIVGHARKPFAESHHQNYVERVNAEKGLLRVSDEATA